MNTSTENTSRPLGYWLKAVDRLMGAELATVFEDEGITRRDWRMLNRIGGTAPGRTAEPRDHGPHRGRRLVALGWVTRGADGWMLTEGGHLAMQRLTAAVEDVRARVAAAVTPEEYTALTASLEKIAREFGWAEGQRLPRRPHAGRRGHEAHGHRTHGHDDHGLHREACGHREQHDGFRGRHFRGREQGWRRTPAAHIHIHTHR